MSTFSKSTRKILFIKCNGICPQCGRKMQIQNKNLLETYMTIDHIIPKSKNGTNNIENLRPMCRKCNMDRGNADVDNIMVFKDVNERYIIV